MALPFTIIVREFSVLRDGYYPVLLQPAFLAGHRPEFFPQPHFTTISALHEDTLSGVM
jgi:hypothetical protein